MSIASNIAEGYGRNSKGEYKHFLGIARGSNSEVRTQIFIAGELAFGVPAELRAADELATKVERMLNSLIAKLD